jgi:methyl-accepting chemotaxis protein
MNHSFQTNYLKNIRRILLWVFLAHIPICGVVAYVNHLPVMPVLGIGLAIFCGPLFCRMLNPGGSVTSFACGIASMCYCGLLIHAARGVIEFHFLIFVELALLIVLRDWLVIVAAAATIAVHHTLFIFCCLPAFSIIKLLSEWC